MRPNPYQQLESEPLPGGRAAEVMEDLRREAPVGDGIDNEENDGDR